jgi:hypothetical protein
VLRAVCTAANSGLCDPNLESNVLMAYMKHHNVLDRCYLSV